MALFSSIFLKIWLRCYYILGDDKKNSSIFSKILQAAENGQKIFPFTSGKNKYDFITVDKLAMMIASVVMQSNIVGIINCCSGTPISLAEQVETFIRDHNIDIRLEYGAYPDRPYDSPIVYGDNTKILEVLKS